MTTGRHQKTPALGYFLDGKQRGHARGARRRSSRRKDQPRVVQHVPSCREPDSVRLLLESSGARLAPLCGRLLKLQPRRPLLAARLFRTASREHLRASLDEWLRSLPKALSHYLMFRLLWPAFRRFSGFFCLGII